MALTEPAPKEIRNEAKRLYETTDMSCREIGEKLGVSGQTVQTWSRRSGWTRANQCANKGAEKIAKSRLIERIHSKIERKAESIADRTARIQAKMVDEGEKAVELIAKLRESLENANEIEPDAVLKYAGALKAGVDVNRKLHGLDTEQRNTIVAELRLQVVDLEQQEKQAQVVEIETSSQPVSSNPAELAESSEDPERK